MSRDAGVDVSERRRRWGSCLLPDVEDEMGIAMKRLKERQPNLSLDRIRHRLGHASHLDRGANNGHVSRKQLCTRSVKT